MVDLDNCIVTSDKRELNGAFEWEYRRTKWGMFQQTMELITGK